MALSLCEIIQWCGFQMSSENWKICTELTCFEWQTSKNLTKKPLKDLKSPIFGVASKTGKKQLRSSKSVFLNGRVIWMQNRKSLVRACFQLLNFRYMDPLSTLLFSTLHFFEASSENWPILFTRFRCSLTVKFTAELAEGCKPWYKLSGFVILNKTMAFLL